MSEFKAGEINAMTVLRRTERGQQCVVFGDAELPVAARALLLRLNGLTPLVHLVAANEAIEATVTLAAQLVRSGMAQRQHHVAPPVRAESALRAEI